MANAPGPLVVRGGFMSGFNSLGIVRQLGLMVGLAASVAIGFAVVLWSQQPEYRVLYANMNFADANQVIELLNSSSIQYRFNADERTILVPEKDLARARLGMAASGFNDSNIVGFELMDQDFGLGSSQFMETTRFRRGLEGELARTISNMNAIRTARVHLAIPKDTVFIRDQRKPRASVFLELTSGRQLERAQIAAIGNLVASSIPELDVNDVTIVDQSGRLLNIRDADTDVVLAARQLEYVRQVEDAMVNRVHSILQPIVGLGNFRAEVSADVDFTQVEQANEMFNPDIPALRSEQILEENRGANDAAVGVPGALVNQPPGPNSVPEIANGANGGAGAGDSSASQRNQATRNFELDRSISYVRQQVGGIKRLSVAVVIDNFPTTNPDTGEVVRIPWEPEDIERIRVLIENAVGYSALRGDSINVINSPFVPMEVFEMESPGFWEQDWFESLLKLIGAALFLLILVLGILRPVLKQLVTVGNKSTATDMGPAGQISAELDSLDGSGVASDKVTFSSADSGAMISPNESFDYQINEIRSLVAEDPARVAQALKQWMHEDD